MKNSYLCFSVDEEYYLVPLNYVSAIYQAPKHEASVLGTKGFFLGQKSFRGKVLQLFCFRSLLGSNFLNKGLHSESCIIDFKLNDGDWGGLVQSLEGIISFDRNEVQAYIDPKKPMICGKAYGIKRNYFILDPEKMISKIERKLTHSNTFNQLKSS